MGSISPLWRRSILVVEDEPLIALDIHQTLAAAGASVLAATSLKDALELIAYADIAAAVLDVSLGDDDCAPVCAALRKRAIPFMFYTGYTKADALDEWPDAPAIGKPAMLDHVVQALVMLTVRNPRIPAGGIDEGCPR